MAPSPRVLFSEDQIRSRVQAMGREITLAYQGQEVILLSVLKGSFVFAADLARAIDLPLEIEFLGVQSYGDDTVSSGVVQITLDLTRPIDNKHVLIVEDIVDTGLTLNYLLNQLKARRPQSVKVAALLHKPGRLERPVTIDFLGFTMGDEFVLGYGLDYAQKYRNLPYIGTLDE